MPLAAKTKSFLRNLFRFHRTEADLDDEVRAHLALLTDENLRAGMPPIEAQRAARMALGGIEQVKEAVRQQRFGHWLHSVLSDCRYGLRQLRKSPGFTAVAISTLALGIGANTAIFSVIDAVILRPLPFRDPSRLVAVLSVDIRDATGGGEISYPAFLDWQSQTHSFEAMSVSNNSSFTYTGGEQPESVRGAIVSSNLFSLLGVPPVLGRAFTANEEHPGTEDFAVILSYEFWQSHFGGDPAVLGRVLTLDDLKYTVGGVMPAHFQYPVETDPVELWITIVHDLRGKSAMASQRGVSYLQVIARLKPGVAIPEARSDVLSVQEQLNRQYPENRPRGVVIRSEADQVAGKMRSGLLLLLAAVAFVLLIACANVASLLLARATVRQQEFTVRTALGASRGTIIRQLLAESLLLAIFGGASGLLVARWATGALISFAPEGLTRTSEIALDFRVLAFTFLVAVVTALFFGLAPAVQASHPSLNQILAESGRASSKGPSGVRLRSALVITQLAIAFVLLIGAGLLLRSFHRLLHVDPGFRADHVLTFLLDVPSHRHPGAQRPAFVRELLQSTRALPGVTSASAVFGLPLSAGEAVFTALEVAGHPVPPSERPRIAFRLIESQYFRTMGIRLLEGRAFTAEDEQGGPALAIVNETLARRSFPGENPLGRRIKPGIAFGESDDALMREIVGVVADVKSRGIGDPPLPELYAPVTPVDFIGEMTIVVRTATDPVSLLPAIRSLVASLDKDLPVRKVKTLDQYVSGSISAPRFEAVLLGAFAALAFGLTAIGLYGVISYSVAQRTREVGIRVVLGAQPAVISGMVLRQGALLALLGVGLGLAASLFAVRLIRGLLYDIAPTDPLTFVTVPLLLIAVSLLASYIPARRATRVDPMAALRCE
ncbi:MAG: ABC transporter permease [Candidatus Acidiferrum sp.]